MKKITGFLTGIFIAIMATAHADPLWIRYPSISPDGKQIVFSYKGDLYKVSSAGGNALPLTLHTAHDYMPVWSHDGKWIAFASDRFGNFDVYVIPSEGGDAKRLTYNSSTDLPYDFSPDDKKVIFGAIRNDPASSVRFPTNSTFRKLYSVPSSGGRSILISAAGMDLAHYNKGGDKIIFQDSKGLEDPWRKHHTSSVTKDIWIYDLKTNNYKKVSSFEGEDREPVFGADDQSWYYLSEKNGNQNLFKVSSSGEKQITNFKNNPVRFLSRANNGTLCFTYDGEMYTLNDGGDAKKVNVNIISESKSNTERFVPINGGATEFTASPNGKEIAFVFRGEVFVTAVEGGITKRITNTPYQERNVEFAPDGRTLYYAAERSGGWDIMKANINRKEEPYFYTSTVIDETPVIATDKEEFAPDVSPDGKEIAYLEERNILKVYNIDKKTTRTVIPAGQNFSYADGDQSFSWSPDSKWIAAQSSKGNFGASEIVLYKTDGTDVGTDVTASGFGDVGQQWTLNGKALLWLSDRQGKHPLAYQGASEYDIYAMFFDKDTYDRFKLNKEDYALLKEREEKDKADTSKKTDTALARKLKEPFKMDITDLDTRKIRLTTSSVNLSDYRMSPTGDKLFYTARYEQGFDLWVIDPRTRELKTVAKLGANNASLDMTKDGKTLFVLSDGRISKVETESGKVTPVTINGEMVLNEGEEREYIFNHAWRQFKKKFYDPKLHGVDWDMYRKTYAKFLPHIADNYDFRELLSEMLGEVNASHTGGRYSPQPVNADATASLGLLYDETNAGNGLVISEVISGGPLDKANSKIRAGQTIVKIDGESITADIDWAKLLNRKANRNVLISVYDPATKTNFDEVVKPITVGDENTLLYRRWSNKMRDMVDKISGGKVGYVHVQSMNDNSYRNVYSDVLGKNFDKDALIVDTRFNGGGWLHEDLSDFLSGKEYIKFSPYGFPSGGGEPINKWSKPSCVVVNEGNYSDAHTFPYAYRAKGIGKLIGMPVPGTSTSVWWETQIDPTVVFGIPMIANIGVKENRALENFQLEPDIKVANEYNKVLNGEDQQIEAAVKEMLKEIKERK
jgi:Tol biopolymer transport system component/C-terminal processing protease CtpA/Prc